MDANVGCPVSKNLVVLAQTNADESRLNQAATDDKQFQLSLVNR
jgi:hypothetical protein